MKMKDYRKKFLTNNKNKRELKNNLEQIMKCQRIEGKSLTKNKNETRIEEKSLAKNENERVSKRNFLQRMEIKENRRKAETVVTLSLQRY